MRRNWLSSCRMKLRHFPAENISLLSFQKEEELREQMGSDADKLFDFLRFSRENELDADKAGLEIYLNTSYNPQEALGALEQLEIINRDAVYRELNLDTLFNLPDFLLDSLYNCRVDYEDQDAKITNLELDPNDAGKSKTKRRR